TYLQLLLIHCRNEKQLHLQEKTMRRVARLLLALLPLAGAAPALAQEPTFVLRIVNHRFVPTELEVPAGTKIKLIVKNEDATPEEFESIPLRREKVIPGKGEGIVYVGPLSPGRYEFFGDYNQKTARGFLVVK